MGGRGSECNAAASRGVSSLVGFFLPPGRWRFYHDEFELDLRFACRWCVSGKRAHGLFLRTESGSPHDWLAIPAFRAERPPKDLVLLRVHYDDVQWSGVALHPGSHHIVCWCHAFWGSVWIELSAECSYCWGCVWRCAL